MFRFCYKQCVCVLQCVFCIFRSHIICTIQQYNASIRIYVPRSVLPQFLLSRGHGRRGNHDYHRPEPPPPPLYSLNQLVAHVS